MTGYDFGLGYWWIFPLVMIILCVFFMRKGCSRMMYGFDDCDCFGESAMEILNKRYAKGDIDQSEYEQKKRKLNRTRKVV